MIVSKKTLSWVWLKNMSIAIFTILSIVILFADYLFPLTADQKVYIYTFDFFVVVILVLDYLNRLHRAPCKKKFITEHWYELPAMVPLFITGSLGYLRFLEFFRLVRLYNVLSMIKGSELILLGSLCVITIIFAALGVYLAESNQPNANIHTLHDAVWWSIETITTVTYGEFYPVTSMGRMIAGVTMFAAIGFLWTFIGLVGTLVVTRSFRESQKLHPSSTETVANETKELIKKRINALEKLGEDDLEDLIKLIRTVNSDKKDSSVYVIDGRARATVKEILREESTREKSTELGD